MDSLKIESLKKIRELALKGVDGEKINAQKLLDKLLKKYNLTEEDLGLESNVSFYIKKPKKDSLDHKLFYQLLFLSAKKLKISIDDVKVYKLMKSSEYEINAPVSFMIYFKERYDHYRLRIKKDLEVFFTAFCIKNDLLMPADEEDELFVKNDKYKEFMDASLMAQGLKRHDLIKQLK